VRPAAPRCGEQPRGRSRGRKSACDSGNGWPDHGRLTARSYARSNTADARIERGTNGRQTGAQFESIALASRVSWINLSLVGQWARRSDLKLRNVVFSRNEIHVAPTNRKCGLMAALKTRPGMPLSGSCIREPRLTGGGEAAKTSEFGGMIELLVGVLRHEHRGQRANCRGSKFADTEFPGRKRWDRAPELKGRPLSDDV